MSKTVVFITSAFPFGKAEVWAINELNSILALGCDVIIVPKKGRGKIVNQDAARFGSLLIDLPFINIAITACTMGAFFLRPLFLCRLIKGIFEQSNTFMDFVKGLVVLPKAIFVAKVIKQEKIDHIHSFATNSTATMAYVISSCLEVPWSYTLHSSSVLNSQYKRSFRFLSRSASVYRVISQLIADELSTFIGPRFSKNMVHLGVDTERFEKAKLDLNTPIIIATPGELKEHKGQIYAIEAASLLLRKGVSNFRWFFYGSGPLLNDLKDSVSSLGLSEHCFFPGNIDHHQLLDRYKNHEVDVVVSSSISMPNVFEGIPVSLMEAMSYELPVIATDCGGTRELVDGQTGILVPERNAEVLADSLLSLIKSPTYRREISKNGRLKVMRDFDTVETATSLVNLF